MKYRSAMNDQERYWHDEGFTRGSDIAAWFSIDRIDSEGTVYLSTIDGGILPWEAAVTAAYDAEDNDRQFTPFEFTAAEINSSDDPDAYWIAYEQGISEGILTELEGKVSAYQENQ